ncbi:carbon storage regulator [Ectothiorhodospiraceae bacterium WFHF3C12]|nr:carbon storage regulator [Ectothiorhodospiraceae bacterium WFHF3C12]
MDETDDDGYLILTRRANETLRIGDDILLHVVSVGRNVRISVEAPDDKRILRSELLNQQPRREREAAKPPQAAEPRQPYKAQAGEATRAQPVVRYRRRRRLAVTDSGTDTDSRDRG